MHHQPPNTVSTLNNKRKEITLSHDHNKPSVKKVKFDTFNQLSHLDILKIIKQEFPLHLALTEEEFDILKKEQVDGKFPLNALRGKHFELAIKQYEIALQSGKNQEQALKSMIEYLIFEDKVPSNDIARSIAYWLINEKLLVPTKSMITKSDNLPPEFYNSPFEWIESLVQKSLKDEFLNNIDQPYIPEVSHTMKGFYNRESFTKSIEELVKHDLNIFHTSKTERKGFKYGILCNGSGNGKSRACKEIRNIVLKMETIDIYRKLHCNISLDGSNTITSVEIDHGNLKQEIEGKMIGLRIYARLLGCPVNFITSKLGQYFKPIYCNTNFFTIENIVKKLEEFINQDEILLLTLSIDEFQFLYQTFNLTSWQFPLFSIVNYMMNTTSRICIIPILSGLIPEIQFNNQFEIVELILPPLVSDSDLNLILFENFNFNFECLTPMIKMMNIENGEIKRKFEMLLKESMVIPEVMNLTFLEIKSFFSNIPFKEWSNQSEILFKELKRKINYSIKQYLTKQDSFQDLEFISELLPRLLSGLNLKLTKEEVNLFRKGLIYKNSNNSIYIAPRYFKQIVKYDQYIYEKIEKRDFDRLDLKFLCYRIDILKKMKLNVTIKEIFPSCKANIEKLYELPEKEFTIIEDCESFILKDSEKSCLHIDISKCAKNQSEVYSYSSKIQSCVDAHFWLKESLFLIKYKWERLDSNVSVVKWLDENDFADITIEKFNTVNVYFVMITTSIISQEEMQQLQEHKHYEKVILIDPQTNYFPINLLPYYSID